MNISVTLKNYIAQSKSNSQQLLQVYGTGSRWNSLKELILDKRRRTDCIKKSHPT